MISRKMIGISVCGRKLLGYEKTEAGYHLKLRSGAEREGAAWSLVGGV
jgi:hypothetical protein